MKPPSADSPQSSPPEATTVVMEKQIRRLSWGLVWEATGGFFSFERGFAFTLRSFVLDPVGTFRGFLGADRLRYTNPLKMVVFLSAVTAFLMHQMQAFEVILLGGSGGGRTPESEKLAAFIQRNYNLLLLSSLPVMALVSRGFYWGRVYNFLEHLVLNAFQVCVITAVYLVTWPLMVLWPVTTNLVYMGAALIYQGWLYRRVLGPGWGRAVLTTLVVTIAYVGAMTIMGSWVFSILQGE